MHGDLETSIISTQQRYFGGHLESQGINRERSILYDSVIKYFAGKSWEMFCNKLCHVIMLC
jgi:hypothetical protein